MDLSRREGNGRILDKLTPRKHDGFLWDTHPGLSLRLICGKHSQRVPDILKPGVWQHIAVVLDRGVPQLYLVGEQCSVQSHPVATAQAILEEVKAEHDLVGNAKITPNNRHTRHPDAQWFLDAGLGLFLHWDPASIRPIGISLSMLPGRKLVGKTITPGEFERIVRERDFNLDGKKFPITPNEYWALAKDFKPDNYHPEVWLKKARDAGFRYAVLTTKHCNGFALWPSAYGGFNTKNYLNGRDLVKEYVEACRKVGLKVGLYFSPPDFHFDQDFRNFLWRPLPGLPALGPDLTPRPVTHTPEETTNYHKAYAALVRGQVEELMTNYGKIDLLWFDGKPPIPNGQNAITQERIRELQPGIVINTRMHGKGDYITPERVLPSNLRLKSDEWGEFCAPWNYWSYVTTPFRSLGTILTELVRSRSAGVNYLLGFGPMANGDLAPEAYENLAKLGEWMRINSESVYGTRALPESERASVLATAKENRRYLFVLGEFRDNGRSGRDRLPATSLVLRLSGVPRPAAVKLLGSATALDFCYDQSTHEVSITVTADQQSDLVDVVRVDLPSAPVSQGPSSPSTRDTRQSVSQGQSPRVLPPPTLPNVRYGPHERQVLDFWQSKTQGNAPLLFYIHGGAWNYGDKDTISRGIHAQQILDAGISVVSINYRYLRQAEADGVQPPVIGPLHDAARALQFVRSKATEWKLDKARVGAFGGSAGGASSLWLALHPDLADPNSSDPVARESTRLTCAAVINAQTTLDPQQIVSWIPNTVGYGAHAFGIKQDRNRKLTMLEVYVTDRAKYLPWIAKYSPYALVSADDPPLLLYYKNAPVPPGQPVKDTSHTANYGVKFAEHCREVGLDCLFIHPDVAGFQDHSVEKYLIQKLSPVTDSKQKP